MGWAGGGSAQPISLAQIMAEEEDEGCSEASAASAAPTTAPAPAAQSGMRVEKRGGRQLKVKNVQLRQQSIGKVMGKGGARVQQMEREEAADGCRVRHKGEGLFEVSANTSMCVERVVMKLRTLEADPQHNSNGKASQAQAS